MLRPTFDVRLCRVRGESADESAMGGVRGRPTYLSLLRRNLSCKLLRIYCVMTILPLPYLNGRCLKCVCGIRGMCFLSSPYPRATRVRAYRYRASSLLPSTNVLQCTELRTFLDDTDDTDDDDIPGYAHPG